MAFWTRNGHKMYLPSDNVSMETLESWGFSYLGLGTFRAPLGWRLETTSLYAGYCQALIDPTGTVRALINLHPSAAVSLELCPAYSVVMRERMPRGARLSYVYAEVISSAGLGLVAHRTAYRLNDPCRPGAAHADSELAARAWIEGAQQDRVLRSV